MTEPVYTRDAIVAKYVEIRDLKKSKEDAHKAEIAEINRRLEVIEGYLLADMRQKGETSFSTPSGTAFVKTNEYIKVADKEVFLAWVKEQGDLNFLTVAAAKTQVLEYKNDTGILPPGLNYVANTEIGVRRGKSKE